jgi:2-dehydropantoate 2-reductase
MKILVYGAGNIGSLYAALLAESGQDVSILARGERRAAIRDHGIQLTNVATGEETVTRVAAVEQLDADDDYDLVLVVVPRNHVSEVLPALAKNQKTPNVMFFGNNAAGPGAMVEALGRDRVLLGFPGAAAVGRDRTIDFLILSRREQPTTMGELDGTRSRRVEAIAQALESAGLPVSICRNMDAWLKTHAAEISPTANALYMTGVDVHRLARTRDALVLMLRAIREGYRVLRALGIAITPASHRIFEWLPEPLLLVVMKRMIESDTASLKIGHALGARREMKVLADELRTLAARTSISTPASDRLDEYVDPSAEPIADGSADLPLAWDGVWALGAVLVGALLIAILSWVMA